MAEHAEAPPELFTTEDPQMEHAMDPTAAHTEDQGGSHAEGPVFIFGPGGWVGLAMLVFLAILVWKGVHKVIVGGLDGKIAAIREQLDEARTLRAEAEALRAEYAAKIANAEKDAAAMLESARNEAADASTAAAAALIADKHDAAADSRLADEVISGL
jgi:F-type H+-transporting ATPase subunit b